MVKGIVFIVTSNFVGSEFGESAKEEWLSSLSEADRYAFEYALVSSWYPIEIYWEGGMSACRQFGAGRIIELVRKWGAYAARMQLTGIYRLLLKLGSPHLMFSSAPRMWGTFNTDGTVSVPLNEKGQAVMRVENFPVKDPLFGELTAGWIDEAIRLSGKHSVNVAVSRSPCNAADYFEFAVNWAS